jgi:hypothetical protein
VIPVQNRVLIILALGTIALLLAAGCSYTLQKADGSWNLSTNIGTGGGSSGGTGAGTGNSGGIGGSKSSGTSHPATHSSSSSSTVYQFQLKYYYSDVTRYPRYENHQGCGQCDSIISEEQSDVKRVDLIMDGYLGGTSYYPAFSPYSEYEFVPSLNPRVAITGTNSERKIDWEENYEPKSNGQNGCQGPGEAAKSGHTYETTTLGSCKNIQVRIAGIHDEDLFLIVQNMNEPYCKSDETYKRQYTGPNKMPDELFTKTIDTGGDYHFVCAPYKKGQVRSDEAGEYFFNVGPGEQTTREFSVDEKGVYRIHCSGSKDEVLLPACTQCGGGSGSRCWPVQAATRHRERVLELVITPIELAPLEPLQPIK